MQAGADATTTPFAGLETAPAMLLAISGGPDSMALLHLAVQWRARLVTGPRLHVATVDHGLRTGSAEEAALVAGVSEKHGLPHATLLWQGAKPASAVQEKAREARYSLLTRHARSIGSPFVLTAHHADDQAETVLMRLGRGSGIAGLAAMRRETMLGDGIVLVRPLLDLTKEELLTICRDAGLAYAQDPSNEDPTYLRVRLRRKVNDAAALGLDRSVLLRLARRMARADAALEEEATRWVVLLKPAKADGMVRIDLAPIRAAAPEIVQRVLARTFRRARCGTLSLSRLETLSDAVRGALIAGEPFRGTLGGTVVTLGRTGALEIVAESRRRRGRPGRD